MKKPVRWSEMVISGLIKTAGYSAIVFVALIFFFLLREGLPTLGQIPVSELSSDRWYPIEDFFGIIPLISGSLLVTLGATIISVPFGIATAVFISEIAPDWARNLMKPIVEILGGIPSVVLGFIGIVTFSPYLRRLLDLPTGLSALTGSLLLAVIAIPTIVSVAEDALDAVPRSYRDAALAMGATRWQTIWMVTLPAARSGVLIAVMLGIGRAIGETMAVMMVTGNAPVLISGFTTILSPVRTMTATIAAEMGEVANGSLHYQVLFFVGIVLFLITLIVNLTASSVVFRQRKRSERLLS